MSVPNATKPNKIQPTSSVHTEFSIPSCGEVLLILFREFPRLVASYCLSRAGELPKNNPKNLSA